VENVGSAGLNSTAKLGERTKIGHMDVHVQDNAAKTQHGPYHDNGIDVIWTNQGNLKDEALEGDGPLPWAECGGSEIGNPPTSLSP